jgi:hypothetical protein
MMIYLYISWACGGLILIDGMLRPEAAWVRAGRDRTFWMAWLAFASFVFLGPLALLFYAFVLRTRLRLP